MINKLKKAKYKYSYATGIACNKKCKRICKENGFILEEYNSYINVKKNDIVMFVELQYNSAFKYYSKKIHFNYYRFSRVNITEDDIALINKIIKNIKICKIKVCESSETSLC